MDNTLIFGKDNLNTSRSIKCTTDGKLLVDTGFKDVVSITDPSNNHTLAINADGSLNVVSESDITKIQDSAGNQLLGTNEALNVNIKGVDLIDVGTETGLGVSILNTSVPVSGSVSANITNDFINSHIYGSSDGVAFHHIKTNNNGVVSCNSVIQDANGTDLTSTLISGKQSLDVNVANTTAIPVSGSFYQETQPVSIASAISSRAQDGAGNSITSTATTGTIRSLDVGSTLYSVNGTSRTAITSTGTSLNTNITNTVPVSGTVAVSGTVPVSIASAVPVSGSVNIGTGTTTAGVLVSGNDIVSSDRGLITNSCLYAKPPIGGVSGTALTCIINGARAYLETRDEDANAKLTNIDTKLTTSNTTLGTINTSNTSINNKLIENIVTYPNVSGADNTNTAIKMYQIQPKVNMYVVNGTDNSTNTNSLLGGSYDNGLLFTSVNFGTNNVRSFYGITSTGSKTVIIEYVDINGDLQTTTSKTISTTSGTTLLFTNAIGINKVSLDDAIGNQSVNTGSLSISSVSGALSSVFSKITTTDYFNTSYTCPNNKIAVMKELKYYSQNTTGAVQASSFILFISSPNGNRRMVKRFDNETNISIADMNIMIYPGETLFFGSNYPGTQQTDKKVGAVILQYDL